MEKNLSKSLKKPVTNFMILKAKLAIKVVSLLKVVDLKEKTKI